MRVSLLSRPVTVAAMTYPRDVDVIPMPAPRRRRSRAPLYLTVLAAVIVLAAGGVLLLVAFTPEAGSSPTTFTVTGSVELKDGQYEQHAGNPATCEGAGGYSDIRGGADVSIADANGKTVATGRFQTGSPRTGWCSLWFTITDVPRGAGPYGFWVTHRGPKPYTEAELEKPLTLGFS